jgi:hypothetical protein
MSAALLNELTVAQARRRLSDTSRMSSEQVDELRKVIDRFHAARWLGSTNVDNDVANV